jgi:hypothetical protein
MNEKFLEFDVQIEGDLYITLSVEAWVVDGNASIEAILFKPTHGCSVEVHVSSAVRQIILEMCQDAVGGVKNVGKIYLQKY